MIPTWLALTVGLGWAAFGLYKMTRMYCAECKVQLKYSGVMYISDKGTETLYHCPKCQGRTTVHS